MRDWARRAESVHGDECGFCDKREMDGNSRDRKNTGWRYGMWGRAWVRGNRILAVVKMWAGDVPWEWVAGQPRP